MPAPRRPLPPPSRHNALVVRFWGVRGSVAVPGPDTVRFGGNTACVEVRAGREIVILDAGTGIRQLGKALAREFSRRSCRVSILITHTHWDHIQGFPFFAPAYLARHQIRILGSRGSRTGLRRTVAAAVESPFFPVALTQMPSTISVEELRTTTFRIGRVRGTTARLNHPGGGVAFRLDTPEGSLAYVPDHEVPCPAALANPPRERRRTPRASASPLQRRQAEMIDAFRGVGLLIHDAQYTAEEYRNRVGWGHSCLEAVVQTATACGAQRLVLFHHDPDRTDHELDAMLATARRLAAVQGGGLEVDAAAEGMEIQFHRQRPMAPNHCSSTATAAA